MSLMATRATHFLSGCLCYIPSHFTNMFPHYCQRGYTVSASHLQSLCRFHWSITCFHKIHTLNAIPKRSIIVISDSCFILYRKCAEGMLTEENLG